MVQDSGQGLLESSPWEGPLPRPRSSNRTQRQDPKGSMLIPRQGACKGHHLSHCLPSLSPASVTHLHGLQRFFELLPLRPVGGMAQKFLEGRRAPGHHPGPGRAPRSTDPLCPRPKRPPSPGPAWSQTRPSSPADAQTLWAVGSLHPRLGLEPPSARNSPLTRSRRRRQGTATSPTCLLAVTMLAYTRSSVLGGRLNYNRRPMKLCCLSPNEGYNKNNV